MREICLTKESQVMEDKCLALVCKKHNIIEKTPPKTTKNGKKHTNTGVEKEIIETFGNED